MKNFLIQILMISYKYQIIRCETIKIFDYAIQSEITTGPFIITKEEWQLNFFLKIYDKTIDSVHSFFSLLNNTNNFTNFFLDATDFISINGSDSQFHQIVQLQSFGDSNQNAFFHQKTSGKNWIPIIMKYQNQQFDIYINDSIFTIQTFDYSASNQSTIDFKLNKGSFKAVFCNMTISDPTVTPTNFRSIQYEKKLLGFYFFPFMAKNRQFIENISNPKGQPLFIEEQYQTPSSLFIDYETYNIFSQVKITLPNFWQYYAFYSVKMSLLFSLIAKVEMQNISNQHNIIQLYYRDVKLSEQNLVQNFQTRLLLTTTVNTTTNSNPDLTQYDQNLGIMMQYLENNSIIQENMWQQNYNFDLSNKIANIQYLQHLKADYSTLQNSTNYFYFFLNGIKSSQTNQSIRFSKLDQHFIGFSVDDMNPNFYYDIMITEIIFYQDKFENQNQNYIDQNQTIALNCNLDNTKPYYQERFLINNNDILTLKNCNRLNFLSRCHSFFKCIRCQQGKCIQCANNYYLVDDKCLECMYPFIIVDDNCVFATQTFNSILQFYSSSQLDAVYGTIQGYGYIQAYVDIQMINPNKQIYQKAQHLIVSPSGVYGGDIQWNTIKNYFLQALNLYQFQFRISMFVTNESILQINQQSIFKCLLHYQHVYGQYLNCVLNCENNYYLNQDNFCVKNNNGCSEQHITTYYQCSSCTNGYKIIQNSAQSIQLCIEDDQNLVLHTIENDQIETSINEIYNDLQYEYDSITYPICDISNDQYLEGTNCIVKNLNQANICNVINQDGTCDVINSTTITPGYLKTSNNLLFNYFEENQSNWIYLNCKNSTSFNSNQKNISNHDGLCYWEEHLSNNKQIAYNCLIKDNNCLQCDANFSNICLQCSSQNLIQFKTFTECGTPLPNCNIHIYHKGLLQCEQCQIDYQIVPTQNYNSKPVGLCIDNLIPNCLYYFITDNNIVECELSTDCGQGYIPTQLQNPSCVQSTNYIQYCSEYQTNQQNQYQCIQCEVGYLCILENGIIKQDITSTDSCNYCLIQSNVIDGCYIYDQVYTCQQCYTTHTYLDQNTCNQNCLTFDSNDNELCSTCQPYTLLQNQLCYHPIILCDIFNNIGCDTCMNNSVKYFDTDMLFKCQNQMLNCQTISSVNNNYCDTCDIGYRIFRTQADYDLCLPQINNCQIYSPINQNKCDTCIQDFEPSSDYSQCNKIENQNNSSNNSQNNSQNNQTQTVQNFQNDQCYVDIPNCIKCSGHYCFQCDINYTLKQNKCEPNCILKVQYCHICQQLNQSICFKCYEGLFLENQICKDSCQNPYLGINCFKKLCVYENPNCEQCDSNQLERCLKCKQGYQLNNNFYCIKYINENLVQLQYNKCLDYCQLCIQPQCQNCIEQFQKQFPTCTSLLNDQLKKEIQKIPKCIDDIICFYDNLKVNQHCHQCQHKCILQTRQKLNILQIYSFDKILFTKKFNNSLQFQFTFQEAQSNMIQLQILQLDKKIYQFYLQDRDLFTYTKNCTPQKDFNFEIKNSLFNYKEIVDRKNNIEEFFLGAFFGSFQLFFPSWLVVYLLSSFQKIEVLSYVSFTNLNGGTIFNFFNSLPETEVNLINIKRNDQSDYLRSFKLVQLQVYNFNLIDEASLITLISFLITIIGTSIKKFFQQKEKTIKQKLIFIKEHILDLYVQYIYSFLGILQIYLIPKIGRYFLIFDTVEKKYKCFLFCFDIVICYFILNRLFKHFMFNKLANQRDKKHLSMFQLEKQRLENFEKLFNFWTALDQSSYLLRCYLLFVFQNRGFQIVFVTFLISISQMIYFIIKIIKYHGFIRLILMNYILSEFIFSFYLFMIYLNYVIKTDLNIILNITYFILNFIKIGESFSVIYTIKKLTKDRLSHFDVKEIKVYKLRKTITEYLKDFEELKKKEKNQENEKQTSQQEIQQLENKNDSESNIKEDKIQQIKIKNKLN